jgi:phosphoglycolate phosphatase
VLARKLTRGVKLFTAWDADNDLQGEPGDWLVQIKSDPGDQYIVKGDIFPQLYRAVR